jgi:hypothetical protein
VPRWVIAAPRLPPETIATVFRTCSQVSREHLRWAAYRALRVETAVRLYSAVLTQNLVGAVGALHVSQRRGLFPLPPQQLPTRPLPGPEPDPANPPLPRTTTSTPPQPTLCTARLRHLPLELLLLWLPPGGGPLLHLRCPLQVTPSPRPPAAAALSPIYRSFCSSSTA